MDDVDMLERVREDGTVRSRHHELRLPHRADRQLEPGQDVVAVRRHGHDGVVVSKPLDDVLPRRDSAAGVTVERVCDEGDAERLVVVRHDVPLKQAMRHARSMRLLRASSTRISAALGSEVVITSTRVARDDGAVPLRANNSYALRDANAR